jgi:hypothetical protein
MIYTRMELLRSRGNTRDLRKTVMRERDSSLTLGMTRQWSGTRVVMAVRSANRHHYPIFQKPVVIPNESRKAGGMRNLIGLNRF